jgi:hypothetical protein
MKLDDPNAGIDAYGLDFRLVDAGKLCSDRIIPDLWELLLLVSLFLFQLDMQMYSNKIL